MIELLSKIPATGYVALITAIFTAGITLLGVYFNNKANTERLKLQLEHERNIRKEDLSRERIEDLYLHIEEWLNHLIAHYLPYIEVMQNKISYNDALDITIESGKNAKVNYKRLKMLIELYFPEVKSEFASLMEKRALANSIIEEHKREYKKGNTVGLKFVNPLLDASQKIDDHGLKIKNKLIEISNKNV